MEVHIVKLFLLWLAIVVPLFAGNIPLTWSPAVVESSFRAAHYGEVYHEPAVRTRVNVTPVRESIYIDAGPSLYRVSRIVTTRGMANLREGDKIQVAVKGKTLLMRARGKQYAAHIEQISRNDKPVSSPASPR